ncbi:DUF2927 domain-containing protein [Amorphus sp. 3PC139-8]|uniref:DUF2927 domain-containing protein n=1 Tax=Amorphus sp. 3PC139-8 TaxID=2735676 RepID=UPI00345D2AAF
MSGTVNADETNGLKPRALRDAFFKVVFGLEYGRLFGESQRVKKYTEPVRYKVINAAAEDRSSEVNAFLASLPGKIDGLKTLPARDRDQANFLVFLVDRDKFADVVSKELHTDAIAMGARCLVGVNTRRGRILHSTAVIVADDPYLFKRCTVEEILQGLGPMNDNDSLTESVFNDASRHTTFTPFDQALMRMLYHPSIRPGMTGSQVNDVLPQVLADLGYFR